MLNRDNHFVRLNAYRHTREYIEYAKSIGMDVFDATDATRSLLNDRWTIDERIYREFLEMLPPLNWRGGSFLMREFVFGTITTKYTKEGDFYFCEFVDTTKEPAC